MVKDSALNSLWAPFFSAKIKRHSSVKPLSGKMIDIRMWLGVGLIVANSVLLMSYIYGVNDYATKGYQISVLQKQLSGLNQDNQKINLQVAEAASMVSIQTDFLSANFVPAGVSKFIDDNSNQLTLK